MADVNTGEWHARSGNRKRCPKPIRRPGSRYHGGENVRKMVLLDDANYRRCTAATRDPHALGELEAALSDLGD